MKAIGSGNVYPILPLTATILPNIFLITSYVLGVTGRPHEIHYVPYPSDLGEHQPERGFFTLALSLNACLVFTCVFIRYLQLNAIIIPEYRRINIYTGFCGAFAVWGQCLVFSFSYKEDPPGHYIGAFFFFFLNTMYMIMQTQISRKLPQFHPKFLIGLRFICSLFGIASILLYTFGRILAPLEEQRYHLPQTAEWLLGTTLVVFYFSFVYDFNGLWCESDNKFYEMPHYNKRALDIIEHLQEKLDKRKEERQQNKMQCNPNMPDIEN